MGPTLRRDEESGAFALAATESLSSLFYPCWFFCAQNLALHKHCLRTKGVTFRGYLLNLTKFYISLVMIS